MNFGEIKGKEGLSTVSEALFLIQGLNANDIFPDWIALNNGTTHGIEAGNFKKLNLPFENKLLGQPREIRERMIKRVEDFAYNMLVNVFNAENTASLALEAILDTGSYASKPKSQRIEDPEKWTPEFIQKHAAEIGSDKGAAGDFDD